MKTGCRPEEAGSTALGHLQEVMMALSEFVGVAVVAASAVLLLSPCISAVIDASPNPFLMLKSPWSVW